MSEEKIIQISPVDRESSKIVVGLAGCSGDGKTRSALEFAHGLTGMKPERIGFLDAENGRGKQYADVFGGKKFQWAGLTPPFAPARYVLAMRQFAEADVDVLKV